MLRVFVVPRSGQEYVLRPEGSIVTETMRHLEAEADGLPAVTAVDLDGVRFIDHCGLGLLRRWAGRGVELRGGSLFVRGLLESAGLAARPPDETGAESVPTPDAGV